MEKNSKEYRIMQTNERKKETRNAFINGETLDLQFLARQVSIDEMAVCLPFSPFSAKSLEELGVAGKEFEFGCTSLGLVLLLRCGVIEECLVS